MDKGNVVFIHNGILLSHKDDKISLVTMWVDLCSGVNRQLGLSDTESLQPLHLTPIFPGYARCPPGMRKGTTPIYPHHSDLPVMPPCMSEPCPFLTNRLRREAVLLVLTNLFPLSLSGHHP